jgi:enolase-phosphatase E1
MIKAIVTDIEGTTSSLSFVHDVLFPYSREHLAEFVRVHGAETSVRSQLDEVQRLLGGHAEDAAIVAQLLDWIREDRKIAPLKVLQGMIWEDGYRLGRFQGHVYEDAARRLREWHARGLQLYVYSSGSVHAQKLLFAHSGFGDLTPLFRGYFDTAIGGKRETESYRRIASHIGEPAADILFLSDVPQELDAARSAGMQTRLLLREGVNATGDHPRCSDFDAIAP